MAKTLIPSNTLTKEDYLSQIGRAKYTSSGVHWRSHSSTGKVVSKSMSTSVLSSGKTTKK